MAASWSSDSKSLATSSADCTVKLCMSSIQDNSYCNVLMKLSGDVETRKATATWTLGSGVNHQQVGNTWSGDSSIVSLSISGDLNVFDPRIGDKPSKVFSVSPRLSTLSLSSTDPCISFHFVSKCRLPRKLLPPSHLRLPARSSLDQLMGVYYRTPPLRENPLYSRERGTRTM